MAVDAAAGVGPARPALRAPGRPLAPLPAPPRQQAQLVDGLRSTTRCVGETGGGRPPSAPNHSDDIAAGTALAERASPRASSPLCRSDGCDA
jgi:hypothetical protein